MLHSSSDTDSSDPRDIATEPATEVATSYAPSPSPPPAPPATAPATILQQIRTILPYKTRCGLKILAEKTQLSVRAIAAICGTSYTTAHRIIAEPSTPSLGHRNMRRVIDTPLRKAMAEYIETGGAEARRLTLGELAHKFDLTVHSTTVARALRREGLFRRVAARKPWRNAVTCEKRLQFALACKDMDADDWHNVIFSDESPFGRYDHDGRVFVTRRAGQRFHHECLVPAFRDGPTVMVWGCIHSVDKGPLIRWEKAWGNINGTSFVEHILPSILHYYYEAKEAANLFFNRPPLPALPHQAPPVTVPPHPDN